MSVARRSALAGLAAFVGALALFCSIGALRPVAEGFGPAFAVLVDLAIRATAVGRPGSSFPF